MAKLTSAQVRTLAQQAAISARTIVLREKTKELGGFNDRTRDAILSEANAAALAMKRRVYLDHGYVACGCDALVNPAFARCYVCGAWRKEQMTKAEALFIDALEAASKGVVYTAHPDGDPVCWT